MSTKELRRVSLMLAALVCALCVTNSVVALRALFAVQRLEKLLDFASGAARRDHSMRDF